MVIINSLDAAIDLLEKKSAIYSDRPLMLMAGELMGWAHSLVLSPYGTRFRDIRRLLHRYVGSRGQLDKVEPFHPLIETEAHHFLRRTLDSPERFVEHIRR